MLIFIAKKLQIFVDSLVGLDVIASNKIEELSSLDKITDLVKILYLVYNLPENKVD